jgi:hypothetical protein
VGSMVLTLQIHIKNYISNNHILGKYLIIHIPNTSLNAFIPFLSTKLYGLRKIILFNLKAYFIIKIKKIKKLKKRIKLKNLKK